jgi:hypothetical protein
MNNINGVSKLGVWCAMKKDNFVICPLLNLEDRGDVARGCQKRECAWYNAFAEECSIKTLCRSFGDIAANIKAQTMRFLE